MVYEMGGTCNTYGVTRNTYKIWTETKENDYSEELVVCGRIMLNTSRGHERGHVSVGWFNVVYNRFQWRYHVKTIMRI
jgi:hypothetical protein